MTTSKKSSSKSQQPKTKPTTRKTKTTKETAQDRLDDALKSDQEDLEMYEEKPKSRKIVKKSATEEALEMFATIETGQKIGQAAVENPVFGAAIVFGAAATIWKLHNNK